jgi:hypothetical protein
VGKRTQSAWKQQRPTSIRASGQTGARNRHPFTQQEHHHDYNTDSCRYLVKEAPDIRYTSIRPNQIVFPDDMTGTPAQRRLK